MKDAAEFDSLQEIEKEMKSLGITQNKFDRIISIEMLEHMKNYEVIFSRLKRFVKPEGKVFVQVLCMKDYA